MNAQTAGAPLWTPDPARAAKSGMARFMRLAGKRDYEELHRWSVEHAEEFWDLMWKFGEVRGEPGLRRLINAERMPGAQWFPEATLNFAENLLRERDASLALSFWGEDRVKRQLSRRQLYDLVSRLAQALTAAGVTKGDRVAGYLPNLPESVAAMLATASLGAIWSSCSPDFGAKGVLDRFGQIRPKVLFACDGYRYAGKPTDLRDRVREVAEALPDLVAIVGVPWLAEVPDWSRVPRAVTWEGFAARGAGESLRFERLPFDHPLYILYSSGTTGLPKCIVHSAGGTLLQHLKELSLHTDLKPGDRIFYFTTCGWMMWNWLVSSLAVGATVVLYDGAPLAPEPGILWRLAAEERLAVFGTSAKYLALSEKEGLTPGATFDLRPLKAILSTGSPLAPASYDWVYRAVKPDLRLSSISGGTDIVSCFALGDPTGPVYRGELQCLGLGMAVEVWDAAGRSVVGEPGELVCTRPFPAMPVAFWDDPEGAKYHSAYFDFWPGVWRHGDWAEATPRGGLVIYGRSDATLNPGGVRIGTAEIYRQVEQEDAVLESLVIGQNWGDDVRIVLFVRLRAGLTLDDGLRDRLRHRIRQQTSPHHVPRKIVQVADIPRTLSGKITELAVREVIHGRPVRNVDALANPEALELYRDLPELRS